MSTLFAFSAQVERQSVLMVGRLYRHMLRCIFAFYGHTLVLVMFSRLLMKWVSIKNCTEKKKKKLLLYETSSYGPVHFFMIFL